MGSAFIHPVKSLKKYGVVRMSVGHLVGDSEFIGFKISLAESDPIEELGALKSTLDDHVLVFLKNSACTEAEDLTAETYFSTLEPSDRAVIAYVKNTPSSLPDKFMKLFPQFQPKTPTAAGLWKPVADVEMSTEAQAVSYEDAPSLGKK